MGRILGVAVSLLPLVALADPDESPYGDELVCDPAGAPTLPAQPVVDATDAQIADRLADVAELADYVAYYEGIAEMAAGRAAQACALFDRALDSPLPALALRARLARARCLVETGSTREAQTAVRLLMTRYPGLEQAQVLYRALYPTRPAPTPAFDERGRRRPAGAEAPRIRWRPPGPGEIADRLVGRASPRALPVMKRLSAANLYMEAGRYADAWRFFNAVPARVLGRDGSISAGLAALTAGETEAALRILRPLAASRDDRSIYWAGRAEQLADNIAEARADYDRIAHDDPPGYYSVWAAARLRELDGEVNSELLTPVWLDGVPTSAPRDVPTREEALADLDSLIPEHGEALPWLGRARALVDRGFLTLASEEVRTAHEAYRQAKGNRPRQTGLLRLWRGGMTPPIPGSRDLRKERARLGAEGEAKLDRVARALGDEGLALRIERPRWGDMRSYHRQAWRDLVMNAARRHGVDPDLVWAIMFRESIFNSDVVSHARAIGLMQVIPPTGYEIAEARSIEGFDPSQLFDPETAIDFGAYYLRVLLDRFGGRVPLAIAGYNGGPHNVEKWLALRGNADIDVFCEQIPFTETHRYVRRVLTSLAIYQSTGGGAPGPRHEPVELPPLAALADDPEPFYPEL